MSALRIALAAGVLAVALGGCASDERACDLLLARCPSEGNRETCPVAVRALRDKSGASGVEKATECLEKSKTCAEAASCLAPDEKTGWTNYPPYGGK